MIKNIILSKIIKIFIFIVNFDLYKKSNTCSLESFFSRSSKGKRSNYVSTGSVINGTIGFYRFSLIEI